MQHTVRAITGPLDDKLTLPSEKTLTIHTLLLAALAGGVSDISGISFTDEINTFITALRHLGVMIQADEKNGTCIIAGCNGQFPKKEGSIWCDKNKLFVEFLLAACASTAGTYHFNGDAILHKHSFSAMLAILERQGVKITPDGATHLPFGIQGVLQLNGGEVICDETIDMGLISALLIIAPYARAPFVFKFPAYLNDTVNLTCAMMAEFGVLVHHMHQGQVLVPTPQQYQAKDYTVEPDLGFGCYFFAAAAITSGEIAIPPLKRAHIKQNDIKLLSLLELMGCRVYEMHETLKIKAPNALNGIDIDMDTLQHAFFALVAIAPFAKTATHIHFTQSLTPDEENALLKLKEEFIKLGVHIEVSSTGCKIFPGIPHGGVINPHQDARIAMVFAIIGLKVPGMVIAHTECIEKRYPFFFPLLQQLHGKIHANV